MPTKKKAAKRNEPDLVDGKDRKNQAAEALAFAALQPCFQATMSLKEYGKGFGEISTEALIKGLQDQTAATQKGDLGQGEAMLTAQAHTLDAIFHTFARRAANTGYLAGIESYLKLALRAQSQCRATWEAISAIKNPPMVGFVGQANIANGPQQVNNGIAPTHKRQNENMQNELLEQSDGERLDTGTASAPSHTDPNMEAVEKINRPQK